MRMKLLSHLPKEDVYPLHGKVARNNSVIDSSDHDSRKRQHLLYELSLQCTIRSSSSYKERNEEAFDWIFD